jgi:hypothetical protein
MITLTTDRTTKYICEFCKREWYDEKLALACEKSHEIIYVPFFREDLFKLLQFLLTEDRNLLSRRLVETLQKYSRGEYK